MPVGALHGAGLPAKLASPHFNRNSRPAAPTWTYASVLPADCTHYVVPDTHALLDYEEIFTSRAIPGIVFTQVCHIPLDMCHITVDMWHCAVINYHIVADAPLMCFRRR